ncbi:hypothetical protein N431DRAFT_363028 [Stipitochalara longipes BDJ]|nr:hypothetical protein N431DRAFT_363028 [Stipitochalara longipes BDJ]
MQTSDTPSESNPHPRPLWSPSPSAELAIPPASPHQDFVLFEKSERSTSMKEPVSRYNDSLRFVDDDMAAQAPTRVGSTSPPRQIEYDLKNLSLPEYKNLKGKGTNKLQAGLQGGIKRRLSDSDTQTERTKIPHKEPRFNSDGFPRIPSINDALAAMAKPLAAVGTSAKEYAHAADTKMDVNSDDEEDEDDNWQLFPRDEESIIPNYEGFKAHVRRLNPDMDPRYNWLISRIAHQQEIRYKRLLEMRLEHCHAILRKECAAGRHCLALGGSTTFLDLKGNPREEDNNASEQGPLRVVTRFSDDDSELEEGALTDETFPEGVPMPPTRSLPAEFECQLCFKSQKFSKPSDWTKHVHEDLQPFTCTYEECKEPKSYKRKADWVRHENERHRHLEWWKCQYEDCQHPSYRKDNFLQHLVREHKLPEPKQKTKAAIKKARPTEPAWIMLEQCHHETTSRPQDEPCKFCGKFFTTWKKLTVHLAKHMERISLPILRLVEARSIDENIIISPVEKRMKEIEKREAADEAAAKVLAVHGLKSEKIKDEIAKPESIAEAMEGVETEGTLAIGDQAEATADRPRVMTILRGSPFDITNLGIDSDFLEVLPEEIREEVIVTAVAERRSQCLAAGDGVDLEPWDSLPDDLRDEILEQERRDMRLRERMLEKLRADNNWDVQSLASLNTFHDSALGSSLPSNTSGSLTQGLPKTAQEEILLILFSDQKFRSLLESAASLISKPRFTRNIRRLLVPFQRELHSAAADHREMDATRIIEKHSQWLASRLFDMSDPENKSNAHNMAAHLNQRIDKLPMLESYLAGTASSAILSAIPGASQPKTPRVTQPSRVSTDIIKSEEVENNCSPSPPSTSSDGSEFDESEIDIEIYIDYSNFPNLEHIKNFIIGGAAFENLLQSTFQFLNPQKPPIPSPKILPAMPSEESFEGSGSTATTEITIPDFEFEEDSDDAASVASDDPALTGASEIRILNPREYFDKLETLEREVFEDSSFLFPAESIRAGDVQQKSALLSSKEEYHFQTIIDNDEVVRLVKCSSSARLLHLLECYKIICRTGKSLARLRSAGYLTDALTILAMERHFFRRRVAKLVQIPVQKIINLGLNFESTLKDVLSELSALQIGQSTADLVDLIVHRQAERHSLTAQCEEMLTAMDMTPQPLIGDMRPIVWDCTVQSLQLSVLSYAGAHIQRFDLDLIGSYVAYFQLPIKVAYEDEILDSISARPVCTSIKLRRRQFQCLDKLLGGCQPWVFHHNVFSEDNEPLHLSTTIGSLTDVWGPSWKILGEHGTIPRYDIGNGSIVPWSENAEYPSIYSATSSSEIYCHWISSKDWNEELVEANQSHLPRRYLLDSDILLIGANTEFGLNVNPGCSSSLERLSRLKTQLHDQGALKIPRTFRDKRYIDSHAVQVTGTALGIISGAGTVTYKRRVGHTMKDALVERWRHNLRSPLDLEAFSGVEVSFCTKNARRRRLMHLLAADTMRNYLSTISFNWVSEACEHAYFKALRCPKSFRRFWKDHKEWQENVGNAISICLDALEETGIDEDSGELSALWVESFDEQGESDGESDGEDDKEDEVESPPGALVCQATTLEKQMDSGFCEEHIVTLFRSEHTWTGFLQDSEESLTMAIVGMTCLDFLHENGYGRRCAGQRALSNETSNSKGFAVLQTSLKLNESILKNEKLKQEKVDSGRKIIWDAKELKRGTSFTLGNHGTLKVLTGSTRTCPVIAEWSGIKSEILKEVKNVAINEKMLGRPAERHHCEYIRGSWEAKPLPVLVMSKSTKIIFTKG